MTTERQWAGSTFGSRWMHERLICMLKYVDVRVFYLFAAVCVIPFCCIFSPSRSIIYRYLRQRHQMGKWRAAWLTYLNHCLFAQVVIDRFALYAGKRMKLVINGYEHYERCATKAAGFVILSSHIGCYEMAGYELNAAEKTFNALVFDGEKATVMRNRQRVFDANHIKMIPVRDDGSHLFEIHRALAEGEVVSIPADRVLGSPRVVEVSLLGAKATLPLGSFSVPAMQGMEVLSINVMKTRPKEYTVYVAPLPYDHDAPRKQQVKQLADGYAAQIERLLKQYPTQWYNYFEFWK